MRRFLETLVAALALAWLCGCINNESIGQVKDLRILAIRTNPPGALYPFLHTLPSGQRPPLPLGPYTFTVEALVVDPKGREVEVSYRLCPENSDDACPGYRLRQTAPPAQIQALSPLVQHRLLRGRADLYRGGEVDLRPSSYTFNAAAMDYLIPHDVNGRVSPLALLNPSLPSVVVRARTVNNEQEEIAFHRFMLEADLRSPTPQFDALIDGQLRPMLGVGRCSAEQEAEAELAWQVQQGGVDAGPEPPRMPQCVRQRQAHRGVHLERLLYATADQGLFGGGGGGGGGGFGDDDEPSVRKQMEDDPTSAGEFLDVSGVIRAQPGQSLRLRAVVSSADHQHYQRFNTNSVTGRISISDHDEDMAFSWFTTAGQISSTTSEQSGNADARYQVSPDTPPGPAFVWVVVRDQRGGVDWARIDFDVREQPGGSGGGGPGGLFGGAAR